MDLVTPGIGLIFWMALTFLMVVFVLSRVAWKPILKALKEREDTIDQSLAEAKAAKAEMKKLKASNEQLLRDARTERERMVKEAQDTATKIVAEAQERAKTEAARLTDEARQAIELQKTQAMAGLRNYVAELSLQIAEKVLKQDLQSDQAQKELVSKYLQEAGQSVN